MPSSLPINPPNPALLGVLAGLRRKAKALSVLYGLGVVLAVAVGLLLAVVLLDYLLNLPAVPRLIFLLLAVGGVAYTLFNYVARPLLARLSISDVAGHLENAFPQLDDRLRSSVYFLNSEVPGSPIMKGNVIHQANEMVGRLNLDNALVKKPALASIGVGLGALVLALALALGFTDFARIALSRLLIVNAPSWPKKVQIDLLKAPPAKVASGQRIDLRMRLSKGDKAGLRAVVYYRYDNGPVQQQLMNRADDGTYTVAIDAKGSAMSLWMKAGDDQTAPRQVNVVQRLDFARVEARVTPPPYARLEPVSFDLKETAASMTVGSTVQLSLTFNKPLAADKPIVIEPVKADMALPQITWERPKPNLAVGTWIANQSLRFRVRAVDTDYFENSGLEEFQISVRPDQNPSVVIEYPRGPEDRTPNALVRLQALAEDDFDISEMTLHVKLERGQQSKEWDLPLSGWNRVDSSGERRRFRLHYNWELASLPNADLKPGDVLKYLVRVKDNYNLNGATHPPVASGELKINIISQETLSFQITEAMRSVAERLKLTHNSQNRTRQETANLRQDTQSKPQLDNADRTALNRLTDQQSTLGSQTKHLSGQIGELEKRLEENRSDNQDLKDIAKDVRSTLSEAAERTMSQASQKLSEAAQQADPKSRSNAPQRDQAMEGALAKQDQASGQLDRAIKRMGNLSTFDDMLRRMREALGQQQELSGKLADLSKQTIGKEPDKLNPDLRKKLEDLASEQRKLAEKTDKLTGDLTKGSQQTQKSDPAASKAMEQAAQTAQQQQVSSNQAQAAQSAQMNQQAQAQSKQKQAELGLQMMLNQLKEAERRKLEALSRELAKLQEQIANLIRRQAGHNIDNLRIQGGDEKLKQITEELLDLSERVKEQMPPVPASESLTGSQIQTEGNTRDISKSAESVAKGGAEIAATLIKAAGLMERAIVSLKATNLPEAYDPSQVKALAALVDAREKTDKAMAEVQQQMEEGNRETVRQAYEKIRQEQEAINKETTRIDASPRLPDGSFSRVDAINLGKLPGQQGTLADQTKKLEEHLSAVGGIVYVWANSDIVKSMNEVKADLAKPATGKPTQAEQQRILDQLDAMIRNLAVKPKSSDFYTQGGGGGGGQGKSALPSEAELRLLKELQIALNKSTKVLDAQPEKDKPRIAALGGRQGELRNLLDELIKKASRGKAQLDPEPDPKQRLPEEADAGKVEDQELDDLLLKGKPAEDQSPDDVKLAGQRMARSRQRLALDHDPGKTTQIIQDRILENLDKLIDEARQQQAQANARSKPSKGQQGQKAQANNQGQQSTGVSTPANSSNPANREARSNAQSNTNADLSKDIRERLAEWGQLTPRERQAIIDGMNDRIIPKWKKITDDYYEMMSRKAAKEE